MKSESIYWVDDSDNVIGKATREDARKKNITYREVHVFVLNNGGELYVQQRSLSKDTFPGAWEINVAGHVNYGETYEAAVERELREETAIRAKPQAIGFFKDRGPGANFNARVFFIKTRKKPRINKEEAIKGKFIPLQEVEKHFSKLNFIPSDKKEFKKFKKKLLELSRK